MRTSLLFTLLGLLYCGNLLAQSPDLIIRDIQMVDVETGNIQTRTVSILDGRILDISKKAAVPEGATVIDGEGKWLIPGLVDAHIHLFQSGGLYTRPDAIDLRSYRPYEEEIAWVRSQAGDFLKRYLRCGITTVMDVGGPMANYAIRSEYADSTEFPNLFVTGPLISPYQPPVFNLEDAPIHQIEDAEAARAEVRRQLPFKPDFIKIWYLDGVDFPATDYYEVVKAAIDESHAHNLKVAVHATQLKTAKLAVQAGADFLVHSVDNESVDEEFVQMLLAAEVSYVPTLIVSGNYGQTFMKAYDFSPEDFAIANPMTLGSLMDLKHLAHPRIVRLANNPSAVEFLQTQKLRADSIMAMNLKMLKEAGVRIVTGTDAGNIGTLHASSFYDEIDQMEADGLTSLEILQASTIHPAEMLGQEAEWGSIAEGKVADLVVLGANPLEDLEGWKQVEIVIKHGKVHPVEEIIEVSPEELVQQQLNAYNARDIEAFLEPYSDSLEIYSFPNQLQQKGKHLIRPGYEQMLQNIPDLHCELINRIVRGNLIIDQERVTGFANGGTLQAVAIYEIEDGKIIRVTFGGRSFDLPENTDSASGNE
ncbi:amidohydrolase family protein [Pontibacter sp. G13]|uniref:amidohydrolase family protein n=1 Tax=Pontibacter sp. G13 TaxID=3074898 RepID=UPI00288C52FD|nr:amidohydrolase family protein [Pontibacter sp. G13]WNJ20120.1 amidohydrolase family protein [Pontibacter sp. G13]